ncbi:MAG: 50S ribosomal protein L21 [Alphaproteobacteria bacterium]|nr:50S ribosomal protein L21 [Alphaproteobacteria bacterium]
MFAVIKTGGKQYTVHENDVLWVEKLDAEPGASIDLSEVLMVSDGKNVVVGKPTVPGAKVQATVMEQMRDRKVIIFKKKRRHNYRRKKGHRQNLTVLMIKKIVTGK